jgi:hypothetical protein
MGQVGRPEGRPLNHFRRGDRMRRRDLMLLLAGSMMVARTLQTPEAWFGGFDYSWPGLLERDVLV